ncbi:MAG: response regulator transcription factor [Candidatus Promineifilaceae bacterium]
MARILIAEDEPDIRELIALTLQFNGHDVLCARDGQEAVEIAGRQPCDLILLDVRMPRMTGYEACRTLRLQEPTRATPIFFLSAKGQENEVEAGLAAGADDYILKPFAPDALAQRVAKALERETNGLE